MDREQTRNQYSALVRYLFWLVVHSICIRDSCNATLAQEYLAAKVIAELPMDSLFAGVFTTVLKRVSGLRIPWGQITAIFSLLTTAGASLGLALGCWSPDANLGKTASIPVVVLLMVVGVINPSGVDSSKKPPVVVQLLKRLSPFASAIEALCLGEYPGMLFDASKTLFSKVRDLPKMGGLAMVQNGDQVIEALGLADKTYGNAMQHLAVLCGGYLMLSWIGLALQNWLPKMQREAMHEKNLKRERDRISNESSLSQSSTRRVRAPMRVVV